MIDNASPNKMIRGFSCKEIKKQEKRKKKKENNKCWMECNALLLTSHRVPTPTIIPRSPTK